MEVWRYMENFDLAIIGAGPAGYEAANFAAKQGLKTALIEKSELGGTCLNNGCIPTKTLLHTADLYREMTNQADVIGLSYQELSFDMKKMQARKVEVIQQLREGIAKLMKMQKITVIKGTAQIIGEHEIAIDNEGQIENIEAKNILIATGSVPAMPPIKGAELTINSDELLKDDNIYEEIVIIGGGVIGIEFAFLYASLGKKVIILEALDRILANMDKEFAQSLKMLLTKRNVEIQAKALVQEISYDEETKKYSCKYLQKDAEHTVSADKVLMAVGRRAYTQNLFTENVGLETDRGKIKVNKYYQTNIENIYASGDVIGGIQLAHVATAEAINAVCHMLGKPQIYNMDLIPSCIYTNPEIASVGVTVDEAKALGLEVRAIKYPMGANGKSLLSLQERGFIKVIVDKKTNCILGAQMMCAHATDMISQFTQVIQEKLTVEDLQKIIFPHPTFSEAIGKTVE